ncbi:MAG: dihydrolipoyllysine-residue acetyltransferase [Gammaproteobacteria bacterium]|nr:dihydrolipoyllysine-residue acetyltransferase [Gammaproteobacteria bacterium]MBT8110271.1 dihydrolipoyllysine-residue acetyltransferase [Gammaproteobacteria bacterium]NND48191.1 dihydrolipoyllysine-residue acetyltransferase [Woeseiaceae bacterium]NNL44974.1 dihydrolipoyllysine-residue acetyltransferase [Woeseiaceae bacterium]
MANSIDIVVPDLGDFENVEIIEVLVAPGDSVAREDGLITLETDKASFDVPAPEGGVIESMTVAIGDTVSTGDVIGRMTVQVSDTVVITPAMAAEPTGETTILAAPAGERRKSGGKQTLVVPDLGDFDEVEVIEVHIAPGDTIAVDDPLVTLETDKAAMDVPAVVAGTVESVLIKVGEKISAGASLAIVDAVADQEPEGAPATAKPAATPQAPAPKAAPDKPAPSAAANTLPKIEEGGFAKAHASPSVRKLARELGVNLVQVKGSGAKNRVLHDDVKAFVKAILTGQAAAPAGGGLPKTPSVDFAKFGEIDVQPLTRIQKISGPRLQASWINVPHVTQHDLADITDLEARRQKLKGPAKERGIGLTPLAFVMKACVAALEEYPKVNASLSDDGTSLVFKKYCHLGFAADTEQGLMVPVIRDADKKDVYEIAKELGELSALAREGRLKADQLQGATFTISSLGGIGGTAFTPIVNAPEVAILGVSRSSMQPVWNGSDFEPRLMLPLSLSYDHRVIDGAQAVRFTTFLGQKLADVESLLQAIP